jgi:hypothetical protein
MKTYSAIILLVLSLLPPSAFSASDPHHTSKYAGEETREIKSLSEADIKELESGSGWGLAKAAELNGLPGPAHILEMKEEIALSAEQLEAVVKLYEEMKQEAIVLGVSLIEVEKELNNHFAKGTITDERLEELLENGAQIRKRLRYVHLSTHLKTPHILTSEQISLYNELRGYASDDPCKTIPAGHDPEMWKKHNNCP